MLNAISTLLSVCRKCRTDSVYSLHKDMRKSLSSYIFNIWIVCDMISTLDMEEFEKFKVRDKLLVKMLQKPSETDTDKILKELHEYNMVIQSSAEELDLRWHMPIDCSKAFYLYGTPKFFEVRFSPSALQKTYNWTDAKLEYFEAMYNKSVELWYEFKKSYIEYRVMFTSPVSASSIPCE